MSAAPKAALPAVLVVMGVSGSGKTTVASLLAGRLGWEFEDGDDFHPPANVEKMQAGTPLTDEDRGPWLAAIAAWIDGIRAGGGHGVVTCSALKRAYRDVLIGARADVRLVYLEGDRALIGRRMAARHGHFMPTSLLDSQFRTLEVPTPDENPLVVSVARAPKAIVTAIAAALQHAAAAPGHAAAAPGHAAPAPKDGSPP
ncbi:Gluconokinase [Methylobacterium crusticola]|uniref:Gluconokinase n=1 Tax=Methylobacterium crusticola TaxID=1697972 RepID=A0ABQ4QWF4_9HYPH|nr:gluconokinase [Methylobacterium crusticola]GJD49517.1 Gluconokinase [Methylobacterium crusticola]